MMTIRKIALSILLAAGILASIHSATAQTPGTVVTCLYPWCVNHVQIVQGASGTPVAKIDWNQIQLAKKLTGATILWVLAGAPDYEFRSDSVVITGANATGSSAQFPVRERTASRFALDDLNTNDLTYEYQVRVYRKDSPPGAAPVAVSGSIVNAYN